MTVHAHLGGAARHAAVHRRAVGARSTRSASRSTPTCAASDVRLTQGGEPTFVSIDDREGGEWNTEAMGPTKRVLSAELMERLRAHYGAGGLRALRPGQVVSGRAAAALVAQPVLAQGRRADLDATRRCSPDERDDHGATDGAGARVPATGWRRASGVDRRHVFAGLRGHLATTSGASASCRQRRPARRAPRRPRSSASACARSSTRGLDEPVGYVLPIARDERRAAALALGALVPARRALLPDPGRFADGLPPAARLAAVGARRTTCRGSIRPTRTRTRRRCRRRRRSAGAAGVALRSATPAAPSVARARDAERNRTMRPASERAEPAPTRRRRRARRVGRLRRPHRDLRRAARRPPLRLHAADVDARGLPRPRRRGRGDGARDCGCRWSSKATSRRTIRA